MKARNCTDNNNAWLLLSGSSADVMSLLNLLVVTLYRPHGSHNRTGVSDISRISEHHDGKDSAKRPSSWYEVTGSRHTSVSPRWGTHMLLPCEQSGAPLEAGLSLAQAPEAPGHPAASCSICLVDSTVDSIVDSTMLRVLTL